ncbi:Glycosyl transferase [Frankia canadensis]|uniref:Glycosyl transferase n=1 Tax=Frankia canadensis TaxID=1836972 RepID=A0A2I2KU96_9ACTN|nr:glycosyltransferase [Frankia canadensis]SNQ49236.1 Glycosyl transferase [Frankia canadensis]SOU56526.1 Glycosyl transferase [Frankia canadensis]
MSAPPVPARLSARDRLSLGQRIGFTGGTLALLAAAALAPMPTMIGFIAVISLLYLAVFAERLALLHTALRDPGLLRIPPARARAEPAENLPVYTVLIPAYREPEVLPHLLGAIAAIDYPPDRLDVILLLEEDDDETHAAALAANPPEYLRIVRVPYSEPRTKPKACNVGLTLARGELVTIFDAEDRPDPLQLRQAAIAFREVAGNVVCLQAKLAYFNHDQNLLTSWFTTEYAMWFDQMLPGLVRQDAPIPLGGTSNHFRADVLRELGGWDPFNVTEDADLGVRLHRHGYRTLVLDSVTLEEANSDAINWLKQRSRWYKGYLQTWLVHSRQPVAISREIGLLGFLRFNLFVGGTPLLAILNPLLWALTATWFAGNLPIIERLFPSWLYFVGLVCLLLGNFTFVYCNVVAARATGIARLVPQAVLSPAYWLLMSLAACKALLQLVIAPSFWEKTTHGLGAADAEVSHAGA